VRAVFRWMEASSERWAIADIVTLSAGAGLSQLTHAVAWLGFLGTLIFFPWRTLMRRRMGTAGIRHLASACGPPSQEILPMAFFSADCGGYRFRFRRAECRCRGNSLPHEHLV
jgi:hypothetical protein